MAKRGRKPKPRPPKRPAGRPVFTPTDEQRRLVTIMVAAGIQQKEIAPVVGCNHETLRKHFRAELDEGMVRANTQVVARLFKMTDNNVRAAEFWLTNRMADQWAHKREFKGDLNVTSLEQLIMDSMKPTEKK